MKNYIVIATRGKEQLLISLSAKNITDAENKLKEHLSGYKDLDEHISIYDITNNDYWKGEPKLIGSLITYIPISLLNQE